MIVDEGPRVPRKKRSRKKRRSSKTVRVTKAIGWSLLGLVTFVVFITGAISVIFGSSVWSS